MSKLKKILKIGGIAVLALILILVVTFVLKVRLPEPEIGDYDQNRVQVESFGDTMYIANNGSWLVENDYETWEMYLTGGAYERGLVFGEMARTLNAEKESAFVREINNRVPSESYLNFLKYLVGWFNRDMDEYISDEYKEEIFGASRSLPDSMDYIAPKFHRALSYHGAHDIGHALQNMNLVGCTALGVWGEQSEDSLLLIGRNFDFYFGNEFAKDPILAFVNPDKGYRFASITWACFSGVVSGMNEEGLTVTLNSAKSSIPSKGKTPVSIIAREILQYASTIDEAFAIAERHESFVSESFLIGSKNDGRAAVIEKTPDATVLKDDYDQELVLTNHYTSEALKDSPENLSYLEEGVSQYRYNRVGELNREIERVGAREMAYIMRDRFGAGGVNIGLANEKAINQLLCHHSVIFSPFELKMWVSTPPYQLGAYLAYDLNEVFADPAPRVHYVDSLKISPDPFLYTKRYQAFEEYAAIKDRIERSVNTGAMLELDQSEIEDYVSGNPDGYLTYYYLGKYFESKGEYEEAIEAFEMGLTKSIARKSEEQYMSGRITELKKSLRD